ncbi:hypothetical protein LTR56_006342 [Elasticomyces elasticus]|nr:hypothetical protein LTR56_006342 [Elasticomyces elasticus]KAK3663388.1 hypothetical protein LTR22_005797 [Elasticomyces elasticus]KAK4925467.1 hypothetical protein LTR49_007533 [Elasticomyces elasticus]KAK5764562.1 hypothetical protein LTS12_005294 [Elasticomyces elasticus]
MTTFTKLPAGEQPSISVYPSHKLSKINDNIYGGFTEHMGRCIYGGLYDPQNPNKNLIDENGFRKDVIESMKELNVPVVRYPGGNFVATYHWLDGVGPREKRPRRPELAWLGVESNEIGTDEFMQWCEIVGTEPYLALNFGTGTLDEALAWLEYCNSTQDTYYANLRRKHGREKPYNVKYWALGNGEDDYQDSLWETDADIRNRVLGSLAGRAGPSLISSTSERPPADPYQMTKEDYAKKAYQWAKALKLTDPSIELILCGETGHSSWDFYVLKECVKFDTHSLGGSTTASLIDMHSIHIYTACETDPLQNAIAPRSAERAIEIAASLIDLARIENGVPPSVPRQTICFDEWNVWDPSRAPGDKGAEEKYTLSDALAVAVWLNVFIRQSKYVGMANIAQSVNVISPLMTTKDGLMKQTTWWPLLLFSKYMRGTTIATHVSCGAYEGPTTPAWQQSTVDSPWLDVSATISDDGWVSFVVVNVHQTEAFDVEIAGVKEGEVKKYVVSGPSWDVVNTESEQKVGIEEDQWDGKGKLHLPKMSMTMLRWKQ